MAKPLNPEYSRKIQAAQSHAATITREGGSLYQEIQRLRSQDADPVFLAELERIERRGDMEPNPKWSTAYKNRLPDSAFFYVDKSACDYTDSQGRSHPLSCRHFPYKNHQGNVSLSHVENAISRAPQSNLPPSVQRAVQDRARRLLEREEGHMAANPKGYNPPYGELHRERIGHLVLVVRKGSSPRKGDWWHVRVLDPSYDEFHEKRKAVLFRDDSYESLEDAIRIGREWIESREGSRRFRGSSATMRRNPGVSSRGHSDDRGGKFDTSIDEAVYAAALDGLEDESVGSTDEPPFTYAAVMRNGSTLADHLEYLLTNGEGSLTQDDLRWLRNKGRAGTILFVDSQGFVQVVYYDTASELEKDWAEAVSKLSVERDEEIYENPALVDTKLYTVTWTGGRQGNLTAEEAVALVNRIRREWRESGTPGVPRIQVFYRDGSLVPFADLERSVRGLSVNPPKGARGEQAARAKFDNLRRRAIEAHVKWQDAKRELGFRYGHARGWESWLKATEKRKLERLSAAADRERAKFFDHLDSISPRDWSHGAPSHWIVEKLSFEDAVRPLNEPLSVVPPLAYGQTVPMQ